MDDIKHYAYTKGYEAAEAGKDLDDNLYPPFSDNFYEFESGFFDFIMNETNNFVMSA